MLLIEIYQIRRPMTSKRIRTALLFFSRNFVQAWLHINSINHHFLVYLLHKKQLAKDLSFLHSTLKCLFKGTLLHCKKVYTTTCSKYQHLTNLSAINLLRVSQDNDVDIYRPHTKLREGNVFTLHLSVILFMEGGSLSREGLCPGGLCPGRSLSRGSVSRGSLSQRLPPPVRWKGGRYASYWNAFLSFYKLPLVVVQDRV